MLYATATVMLVRGEMVTFMFGLGASESNPNYCMYVCRKRIKAKSIFTYFAGYVFFCAPFVHRFYFKLFSISVPKIIFSN